MKHHLWLPALVLPWLCLAQPRFILESELRTNFSGGTSNSTFTAYSYDNQGKPTARRVFDGVDSEAAMMSSIRYTYDAEGRCIEELLLGSGGDTLSRLRYGYGLNGSVGASTLRKDGSIRFVDSMQYEDGLIIEQRRHSSEGELRWYRRYGYHNGIPVYDSLYEPDGTGGFSATQASIMAHNPDSTIATESRRRFSGDQWYVISTTLMDYSDQGLVSATTYEGDGATKRLMDSLAYAVDEHGNRVREEHFDNERTKTYRIVFTWHDTQHVAVAGAVAKAPSTIATWRNRRLQFGRPVSGGLILCQLDGRRVHTHTFRNEESVGLPEGLVAGRYVAILSGEIQRSLTITIHN